MIEGLIQCTITIGARDRGLDAVHNHDTIMIGARDKGLDTITHVIDGKIQCTITIGARDRW